MSKTALVTGASSGLGQEFARLFAADGTDLVLVARRRERLDALARELRDARKVSVHVIAADLAVADEVERVVREVQALPLEIEFLVNNAGLGNVGPFAASPLGRQMVMVDVNVRALVRLTHAFLPGMLTRGRGRVLNIGSTAGLQPGPFDAVYYATKAFVNSFTEALSYELKGTGVTATVLHPGVVRTSFGAEDQSAFFRILTPLMRPFMKTPAKGAATSIYLASSPEVEGVSGQYFANSKPKKSNRAAYDTDAAARLWQLSADLVGLPAPR